MVVASPRLPSDHTDGDSVDGNTVVDDEKELVGLCRSGRMLYGIEKWIANGKVLNFSGAIESDRQRESP